MTEVLEVLKMILLFCPFLVLIISYFILKRIKMKQQYVVGFSADLTTLLLFIAIPYVVEVVWQYSIYIIVIIVAILIALVITFIEWRTKKEIKLPNLMRKFWRVYFVALMALYVVVIVAALIKFVLQNI